MTPQKRQEARQVVGDRRLSVLRGRVKQEVRIQLDVVPAIGGNQERYAIVDALPVQPADDRINRQALQRWPGDSRHRKPSTCEMDPPPQDRHLR